MAKLKAPLLSLGASQQIGKALVFFSWKGLNVVREYVVPSNPQTTPQTTQRGYLTNAVSRIHAVMGQAGNPLDEDDKTFYALWASVVKSATTWFNQLVKHLVDCQVAAKSYLVYSNMTVTPGAGTLTVDVWENPSTSTAGTWYYGTSKTALVNTSAAVVAGAKRTANLAGLTAGVKYYFQYRATAPAACNASRSGIGYGTPT